MWGGGDLDGGDRGDGCFRGGGDVDVGDVAGGIGGRGGGGRGHGNYGGNGGEKGSEVHFGMGMLILLLVFLFVSWKDRGERKGITIWKRAKPGGFIYLSHAREPQLSSMGNHLIILN